MDAIPLLDHALSGLHVAQPAGVFPFLAEGDVAWVEGVASRPELRVGRGPLQVATVRGGGLRTAANIVSFPGLVRRDYLSSHGSVVETVLATPTLPLVVVQWSGAGTSPDGIEVVLHRVAPEHVTRAAHGVVATGPAGEIAVQLTPRPFDVTVDTVEDGVRVVLEPDTRGAVSLVLAFPDRPGRVSSVSEAARHAASHAVRAAQGPEEGLLLQSGLRDVDEAVEWLRARLAGQARRLHEATPMEVALVVGLAASSLGDRAASEAAVKSAPKTSMTRALLAARHAAVFGDTAAASECARDLVGSKGSDGFTTAIARFAASELADALHLAGDPATIAALRTSHAPAGGRSLPMVGRPSSSALIPWLQGVLNGAPDRASPPSSFDPRLDSAWRAAATFRTDPDDAWVRWRTVLAGDGPGHTTTVWDEPTPADPSPSEPTNSAEPMAPSPAQVDPSTARDAGGSLTAGLLLALTSGVLGLRADAAAGRIRLAPTLPRHLTSFGVSGVVVGRSTVALTCSVTDKAVIWELTPERGAVPPQLVFEPSVSGRVDSVRVDGEVADLDVRTEGARTVVPVQLPLDAVRTIEIRRTSP